MAGKRFFGLLAAGLVIPALTFAQDAVDLCGVTEAEFYDVVAPVLVGTWTANPGAGLLTIGGRTIPIPPGQPEPGTLALEGQNLTVATSQGVLDVDYVTDEVWRISEEDAAEVEGLIGTEDLGLVVGCDAADMLRLTYNGTISDGGGTLTFRAYMFVVTETLMYGTIRGEFSNAQGAGTARRVMVFRR